jgi:hypothetical protein
MFNISILPLTILTYLINSLVLPIIEIYFLLVKIFKLLSNKL